MHACHVLKRSAVLLGRVDTASPVGMDTSTHGSAGRLYKCRARFAYFLHHLRFCGPVSLGRSALAVWQHLNCFQKTLNDRIIFGATSQGAGTVLLKCEHDGSTVSAG